jgi:hypothetical protein
MGREKMKSHSRRFTGGLALLGGLLVLLLCSFAVAQEPRVDEQPTQTKNELAIYVPNPFREKTPLNPLDLILYSSASIYIIIAFYCKSIQMITAFRFVALHGTKWSRGEATHKDG